MESSACSAPLLGGSPGQLLWGGSTGVQRRSAHGDLAGKDFYWGGDWFFPMAQVWFWSLAQKPGTFWAGFGVCPLYDAVQGVGDISRNSLQWITAPLPPGRRDVGLTAAEPWLNKKFCPRTESVPVLWQCSVPCECTAFTRAALIPCARD